jgi:predicted nucleic acid-binding protein
VDEIDVDRPLPARAGDVAEAQGLRGFGAVQLTVALSSGCDVFVAADRRLCEAARRVLLAVLDLDQVEE